MMTDEEAGREVCENPLLYVLFQQALANLGVIRCTKVKSESEVPQLCLTLSDPMD